MTVYYVRPNLVDLGDTTGYSLTSGGPSANAKPGNYAQDTVVFDQNSGAPRGISGYFPGLAIQLLMTVPMYFAQTVYLAQNSVIMGTVPGIILTGYNGNSYSNTFTLDASQCTVGANGLQFTGGGYWKLVGSFTTTGPVTLSGTSYDQYLTCAAGANITCGSINISGSDNTSTPNTTAVLFTGSGITITVTGAPASSGASVCYLALINSAGTNTVVLTDKGALVKGVLLAAGSSWNFVNNTGNSQGTGGVQFIGDTTFNTYDCGKGAVNIFGAAATFTATNWIMDGAGQYNVVKSTGTTPAVLAKQGGGTIAANFCSFSYITANTAAPATTIRATNSKSIAGNTGLTLVGMTSRFMPFF